MTMVSVLPTSQGHSWNEMFIKEGREGGGRERERVKEKSHKAKKKKKKLDLNSGP